MFGHYIVHCVLPVCLAWIGQLVFHSSPTETLTCRCLFGDPCWPSQDDFAQLASNLSKPLIYPLPTAYSCYIDDVSPECQAANANWDNGTWRADKPGSTQYSNFEAYVSTTRDEIHGCFINTAIGLPCEQGNISPVGVDARSVQDVRHAVRFAEKHHLRLVVKNTG